MKCKRKTFEKMEIDNHLIIKIRAYEVCSREKLAPRLESNPLDPTSASTRTLKPKSKSNQI
jgi:hypothetical protein